MTTVAIAGDGDVAVDAGDVADDGADYDGDVADDGADDDGDATDDGDDDGDVGNNS